jgi:hypothetical protein
MLLNKSFENYDSIIFVLIFQASIDRPLNPVFNFHYKFTKFLFHKICVLLLNNLHQDKKIFETLLSKKSTSCMVSNS